jgi:hypothetical protein
MPANTSIPGTRSAAEIELRRKIFELNRLTDYRYTPDNIVMVTVDDMVELIYDLLPYTMQKLDEARALETRYE